MQYTRTEQRGRTEKGEQWDATGAECISWDELGMKRRKEDIPIL